MSVETLIDVINQFAAQQSNPVLEILPRDGHIEYDRKYPEPILDFATGGVCAYYHCHSTANRPAAEHGHFHIFLQNEAGQWCHLAGLSVDAYGQPLQWFTVNHWVTGEAWGQSQVLLHGLACLVSSPQHNLVEQWLLALLQFYEDSMLFIGGLPGKMKYPKLMIA